MAVLYLFEYRNNFFIDMSLIFFQLRKVDFVETMESTSVEEHEGKDATESSSRVPTHLAQLWSSPEDSSILGDDDLDSISMPKGRTNANKAKHLQLMAALSQNKPKVRGEAASVVEAEIENSPRSCIPISPCPYPANGWPFSPGSLLQGLIYLAEREELKYELK